MLHESELCSNANLHMGTKSFSKLLATAGLTKIKLQIKRLRVAEQMDSGLFIKRNPLSKESELQPQAPRERKLRHNAGQEVPRQKQANKTYTVYFLLSSQTKGNYTLSGDRVANTKKRKRMVIQGRNHEDSKSLLVLYFASMGSWTPSYSAGLTVTKCLR